MIGKIRYSKTKNEEICRMARIGGITIEQFYNKVFYMIFTSGKNGVPSVA